MSRFLVDPQIQSRSHILCDWPLCCVFLYDDARYHWGLLVPRRLAVIEICDLDPADQAQLTREIAILSRIIRGLPNVEKLNIGALGNIVSQLHVHIVGRFRSDPAWPGPVWGHSDPVPWSKPEAAPLAQALRQR